ncbi:MAG: hypothetical protein J5379_08450 [Clostridiales bacterium]|nr:hypothetical protein [Clostridiales bacterium]
MSKSKRLTLTMAIMAVCLIVFWAVAVYLFPGASIFSRPVANYNSRSETQYIVPAKGNVYEDSFYLPFERLFSIEMQWEEMNLIEAPLIDFDMQLLSNGQVVYSKKIQTPNESFSIPKGLRLEKDAAFTFRIVVNSNDYGASMLSHKASAAPCLTFNGDNYGAGATFFTVFWFLSGLVAMVTIFVHESAKDPLAPMLDQFDKLVIGLVALESILMISFFFDHFCIARTGDMILSSDKPFHRFYDYLYDASIIDEPSEYRMLHNYSPLLYIVAAILSLPARLMPGADPTTRYGTTAMFIKLVVFLLWLLAAHLLNGLLKNAKCSDAQRKTTVLLFFTSSYILYAVPGFGQLDIIYFCIFLYALRYYGLGNNRIFALVMSVGIAFKAFPIMACIPLILLYNKKVKDILINLLISLSIPGLLYGIFCLGTRYGILLDIANREFPFSNYLMGVSVDKISFFVFAYTAICVVAYFVDISGKDQRTTLMYGTLVILAVYTDMLVFMTWHPQWMTMYAISLAILLPFYTKFKSLHLAAFALETLLLIKVAIVELGTHVLSYGILTMSTINVSGTYLREVANNISPHADRVVTSMCAGVAVCLLVYMIVKNPDRCKSTEGALQTEPQTLSRLEFLARLVPFQCLLLLYVWCYCFTG